MDYSTEIGDDWVQFKDRWGDTVVFEYNSQGRVEIVLGTGDSVLLEKSQVLDLIKALVNHVASGCA